MMFFFVFYNSNLKPACRSWSKSARGCRDTSPRWRATCTRPCAAEMTCAARWRRAQPGRSWPTQWAHDTLTRTRQASRSCSHFRGSPHTGTWCTCPSVCWKRIAACSSCMGPSHVAACTSPSSGAQHQPLHRWPRPGVPFRWECRTLFRIRPRSGGFCMKMVWKLD